MSPKKPIPKSITFGTTTLQSLGLERKVGGGFTHLVAQTDGTFKRVPYKMSNLGHVGVPEDTPVDHVFEAELASKIVSG